MKKVEVMLCYPDNFWQFLYLIKQKLNKRAFVGTPYGFHIRVSSPSGELGVHLYREEKGERTPVWAFHISHRDIFGSKFLNMSSTHDAIMKTLHYYKTTGKLVPLLELFFSKKAQQLLVETNNKLVNLPKRFSSMAELIHTKFSEEGEKGSVDSLLGLDLEDASQLSMIGHVGDTYLATLKRCSFCIVLETFLKEKEESESMV